MMYAARQCTTLLVLACAVATGEAQQISTVRAAALLNYPYVVVDTASGRDTVLALSNAAATPTDVFCVYENATSHCDDDFSFCRSDADCSMGFRCTPGWSSTNFTLRLTPGQPLSWRASHGQLLPLGAGFVPPLVDPFFGALRCVAVDDSDAPTDANVLEGVTTIERMQADPPARLDVAKYNAIGIAAISGANNGDGVLSMGSEYAPCPALTDVSHFFEGAADPASPTTTISTTLVLLPCSADYQFSLPAELIVHYQAVNEFEQRLGTSKRMSGWQASPLPAINPVIFAVGVQGTLTGHTQMFAVQGGILALAIESHTTSDAEPRVVTAAFETQRRGIRPGGDSITLPPLAP